VDDRRQEERKRLHGDEKMRMKEIIRAEDLSLTTENERLQTM
jgi:hypothetical protein